MKFLIATSAMALSLSAFAKGPRLVTYVCEPMHPHDGRVLNEWPERVKHYRVSFDRQNAYLSYSSTAEPATPAKLMTRVNTGITGHGGSFVLDDITVTVGDGVTVSLTDDPDVSGDCQTR